MRKLKESTKKDDDNNVEISLSQRGTLDWVPEPNVIIKIIEKASYFFLAEMAENYCHI